MASGPITSWQIDGETVETVSDFFEGAPKKLQRVGIEEEDREGTPGPSSDVVTVRTER